MSGQAIQAVQAVEAVQTAQTVGTAQTASENHEPEPAPIAQRDNLPEAYGGQSMILLPVEPHLGHAYWDFAFRPQSTAAATHSASHPARMSDDRPQTRPVLRLYEFTGASGENANGAGFLDVDIELAAGSSYVHLDHPGRSYLAELGFKAASGHFFAAVRSNVITAPRAEPLSEEDDRSQPLVAGDAARAAESAAPAPPEETHTSETSIDRMPLRPVDCWLPAALAPPTADPGPVGGAGGGCPQCLMPGLTSIPGPEPIPGQMPVLSPTADGIEPGATMPMMAEAGMPLPAGLQASAGRKQLQASPDLTSLCEQGFVSGNSSK